MATLRRAMAAIRSHTTCRHHSSTVLNGHEAPKHEARASRIIYMFQ